MSQTEAGGRNGRGGHTARLRLIYARFETLSLVTFFVSADFPCRSAVACIVTAAIHASHKQVVGCHLRNKNARVLLEIEDAERMVSDGIL